MKIVIAFLVTFGWGGTTLASSQDISIPQAPRKVEFADVTVKLSPRAQQIVPTFPGSVVAPAASVEHLALATVLHLAESGGEAGHLAWAGAFAGSRSVAVQARHLGWLAKFTWAHRRRPP